MVYVLAFIACVSGADGRCERVELPWDGSLVECRAHAQFALAAWAGQHPGYVIRGRHACLSGRAAMARGTVNG